MIDRESEQDKRCLRRTFSASIARLYGALSIVVISIVSNGIASEAIHAVGPGAAHRFGPQLNGVLQRGAGTAAGYDYSAALVEKVAAGLDWNAETLGAYIEAPMEYIVGTKMAYPGLKEQGLRARKSQRPLITSLKKSQCPWRETCQYLSTAYCIWAARHCLKK